MPFATAEDIAARLGRDLTPEEIVTAQMLCEGATSLIALEVSKTDAWADALIAAGTVPRVLRMLCIEIVNRVASNPEGLSSLQEQLGSYQYTRNFRAVADAGGLLLSAAESMLANRVVWGSASGSFTPLTVVDELYDIIWS